MCVPEGLGAIELFLEWLSLRPVGGPRLGLQPGLTWISKAP
jgi:hypothetical protein